MGGRREVSIISHRPMTSSDLKQEMSFFGGSVSVYTKQELIDKLIGLLTVRDRLV